MLTYRNVNDAYNGMLEYVESNGVEEDSRNGKVLTVPHPVLICIECPYERVLFDQARRANPFFHLMEAQWMLEGRNDVAEMVKYNKRMAEFSDDGATFNGAYGYRWRHHFGYDQMTYAINELAANPHSRRVVISMWDGAQDLTSESKDKPCNTSLMFRVVDGCLDMTSTNRSNDLVWGLCGANAVHLIPIGRWYHCTNNLHVYEHHWELMRTPREPLIPYPAPKYSVGSQEFYNHTVGRARHAWHLFKQGEDARAMALAESIHSPDWRLACTNWLAGVAK